MSCQTSCCILRCPPAGPSFTNEPCITQCSDNPLLSFGDTFHIPQFFTNNFADFPGQDANTNDLQDDNWNSWTNDPVDRITDLTYTSKNSALIAGQYYVEYWYANQSQAPIVANMPPFSIGDASAEPQNIYNYWMDQAGATGKDINPFSQVGVRFPMIFSNNVFYFQFKTYMCRFVMLAGTANPDDAQVLYGLVFVPVQDNYFFKVLETTDYSMTRSGQNLVTADQFNQFFAPAGINQAVPQTTWDQIDPSTEGVNLNVISRINKFDQTAFSAVVGTGETMHSHTLNLDPSQWTDNPSAAYGLIPIISPQANLECFLTMTKILNSHVVYRAAVRGWWVLTGTETVPTLSNTFVYRIDPPDSPDGTGTVFPSSSTCGSVSCCTTLTSSTNICGKSCDIGRIIGISSTTTSTPGTNVLTFQMVSALEFWLLPCDRDGNKIPCDVLNILPRTITSYVDYSATIPVSTTSPRYNLRFVFPESETIAGKSLQDLLLAGDCRLSMDEGASYSQWFNINLLDPYLSDSFYVGTGTPAKYPGCTTVIDSVTPNTLYCNGEAANASNPSTTTPIFNDYLEVTFPLDGVDD